MTHLQKVRTTGTLLEFSRSHVKNREGLYGVVAMSCGIKLVGSFDNGHQLREGMKVRMSECGIGPDGAPFYRFVPVGT